MTSQSAHKLAPFPDFDQQHPDRLAYIEQYYAYVVDEAEQAVQWYLHKRLFKKRLGSGLRYCALLMTTLAGVLPLISSILQTRGGELNLDPGWSTLAVALAALAVAVDKFGGFTSGWVRYLAAAQRISASLECFKQQWLKLRLLAENPMDDNDIATLLTLGEQFLCEVRQIIRLETDAWSREFLLTLSQFDELHGNGKD